MEFEELDVEGKKLLLNAYNYEVDEEGIIIDATLKEPVISKDTQQLITLKNVSLLPGSLNLLDTTPLTISKFLREKIESKNGNP
ncbi:hypothetical protein KY315_01615 [Candidatus Woesearchaeota archaeon]|nr:hypothetical protein [Candidatus Woesearchaeota archaeon]